MWKSQHLSQEKWLGKKGQAEFFLPENSSGNLVPSNPAKIIQHNNVNMTKATLNPDAIIPINTTQKCVNLCLLSKMILWMHFFL